MKSKAYDRVRRPSAASGVVAACLAGNLVSATPILNSTFGMFLVPIATEFGWPRSYVALALTIVAVTGLLAYPMVGKLADRVGVRRIALAGNLLFAASVAALSLAQPSPASFFGLFVLAGLCAAAPSTVLYAKTVANWFVERRGVMLGLTAGLGNGLGSTLAPPLVAILIAHGGWRLGYMGLGAATLLVGFPMLWFFLRDRRDAPAAAGEAPCEEGQEFAEAVRSTPYWLMLLAIGLGAGALTALFSHIVPMLTDRRIGLAVASLTLVAFAFTSMLWQVVLGWMLDRAAGAKIVAPMFLLPILGVVLISRADDSLSLIAGGVLLGIGLGTEYGLLPYWVPRYFGRRAYGAIYGSIYGVIVLIMGITPALMDAVFDAYRSYDLALAAIGVALLAGALLCLLMGPYAYDRDGRAAWPSGSRRPDARPHLPAQHITDTP